jgi:hypothetical protein
VAHAADGAHRQGSDELGSDAGAQNGLRIWFVQDLQPFTQPEDVATLDDDMIFHPTILDVLAGRRQEVVAVNYLIKTDPAESAEFVACGLTGGRIRTREQDTGIVPIAYTGFGASLFDLEAFKRTPQPWFQPRFDPATDTYTTEDNPCYERLRNAGATVYLDHDASKLVSHLGTKAWHWSESKPKASVTELKKETA